MMSFTKSYPIGILWMTVVVTKAHSFLVTFILDRRGEGQRVTCRDANFRQEDMQHLQIPDQFHRFLHQWYVWRFWWLVLFVTQLNNTRNSNYQNWLIRISHYILQFHYSADTLSLFIPNTIQSNQCKYPKWTKCVVQIHVFVNDIKKCYFTKLTQVTVLLQPW